jgi:hypothetical protein
MREWQKKIVVASTIMMKRTWISWPRSFFVRAIARSGVMLEEVGKEASLEGVQTDG